ncbi:MAG: HlyD family type I secretion periplasmic adaptor subunit [Lentisphaeria bacterium]|nr:HlyD family type I secretion periplasmic adaptor subunit [Lentisphaeria bacterium]
MSEQQKNNKKEAIPANAVEFLPDAQEIREERLKWYERIGITWIFVAVLAVILWACFAKVDIIVRAHGRVVSGHGDIVMKPRESAVIAAIEVSAGDIVEKGQTLMRFDPSLNQAEVERLSREVGVLRAQRDRLKAEASESDYVPAPETGENGELQLVIYRQRKSYYDERMRYFESNCARIDASIKSTKDSEKKYREILQNTSEIENMYLNLREKNVVAYKEVLEVAMTRMEVEAQVDALNNQLLSYEQQKLSIISEKNSFVEQWLNSISEEYINVSRELDGNEKMLMKAESLAGYVTLTAPCRAVVQDMASFPVGSAVGEAEAVITLVPLEGMLEIEAEVLPQDIGRVQTGNEARVKLSAFPFQKHGTLNGLVRMISANTFTRDAGIQGKASYYRTHVVASGKLRNVPDNFELIPGMEAEVELKTGRRRVIEYLIYPIIKGFDEAFREP